MITNHDLKILKICCEEPGILGTIIKLSKMKKQFVIKTLNKLKRLKFIYEDEGIFVSTSIGDKYYYRDIKKDLEFFEIWLDDKKIAELIKKLNELKESKEHIHFDDKKKNHVLFVHENSQI